ncbi:MAG: hypothetical protein JG764_968 [Clostridiales bacterium]|jgi:predicted DNA-binding protein|nr:hypothetical protein [Clostridiales bacterium]
MEMEKRLGEMIGVRFGKKISSRLKAEAEAEGISVSEKVREIVEKHYQRECTRESLPALENALRKIVDRHVERLAGLCVHAGIAAGTSAWLVRSILKKEYGADTTPEIWAQAVTRAKENLKRGTMEERKEE